MSNYGSPFELARFLRKDWLKTQNKQISSKAFMPRITLIESRMEISCFEIQGLNRNDVFDIATINDIKLNHKPPVGYAVIPEHLFLSDNLELDHNDKPTRHVDIIGWEKYRDNEKEDYAFKLAEIASRNIIMNS